MTAFNYPAEPHLRRHGPRGYADAASYRPWLRDEFAFRSVYCLFREQWVMWMEIVDLAAREDPELHRKLMGFPGDLPNVARLRPPGGNSRPEGIEQSYFVTKQKELLPETY
jgi:hypothetical protein